MGEGSAVTPDQGKQVTTPDPGKNVTPDVSKLVSEGIAAAMAPVLTQFEALTKTVNGLAATQRRADEGKPKGDEGKSKGSGGADGEGTELRTLRDELATMRAEREADKKRLALKDALDAHGDAIVGRKHLEKLIGADLELNSEGVVVAKVDGKHVPLAQHVKTFADDPQWQKPSGTQGSGKPSSSERTASSSGRLQIKRTDLQAKAKHSKEIAAGQVDFID